MLVVLAAAGCKRTSDRVRATPDLGTTGAEVDTGEARAAPAATDVPLPEEASLRHGWFFSLPGAPDPLACTTDDGCDTAALLDDTGCCAANPPVPVPMSEAYFYWKLDRERSAECARVQCPPPPPPYVPECPPAPPPDCCFRGDCEGGVTYEKCPCCEFHVRCINGWCRNACPPQMQPPLPGADGGS
jgi:hypothetical protein